AVEIAKQERTLSVRGAPVGLVCDGVDVAVGDEEVEEAVIVKIDETGAPTEKWNSGNAQAGAKGNINEICVAFVAIESLVVVGEGSDEEVELAVTVVVTECDAHG